MPTQQAAGLCRRTGWRLRLLTRNGPSQGPSGEEIRRAWGYNARTAVVICDPTSPNILQFQVQRVSTVLLRFLDLVLALMSPLSLQRGITMKL